MFKKIVKKIRKMLKFFFEKIRKNRKKNQENLLKTNLQYFYMCIYVILSIFDESWKKKETRQISALKGLA